jgi:hypothetical protein
MRAGFGLMGPLQKSLLDCDRFKKLARSGGWTKGTDRRSRAAPSPNPAFNVVLAILALGLTFGQARAMAPMWYV